MDLYRELGVEKDASADEIKRAYRKQAKSNHPDKKGSEEKMQNINRAYAVLKNPLKRDRYDRYGEESTVDNDNVELTRIICEVVQSLIQRNPAHIKNFLTGLKHEWERNYKQGKAKIIKEKESLEAFHERIIKNPDNDIIGGFIQGKINVLELQLLNVDKDFKLRSMALAILLDDYEYKVRIEDPWSEIPIPTKYRYIQT